MFKRVAPLFAAWIVLTFSVTALAIDMQEGKWEITMEMKGLPVAMPPVKHSQCLTRENMVPQDPEIESRGCKVLKNEIVGNTVSWSMKCDDGEGPVESSGTITYKGDSFAGVMNMTVPDGDRGTMKMQNIMSGLRVGACD